jgi:hypothetical protein
MIKTRASFKDLKLHFSEPDPTQTLRVLSASGSGFFFHMHVLNPNSTFFLVWKSPWLQEKKKTVFN